MKYHLYADDTQIYLFFKPGDILAESIAYARLQQCLYDIKVWMFKNKLKLNSDKTEYMVIGRRNLINKIENVSFKLDSSVISKSNVVKNLGVYFDDSLSMTTHIYHVCRSVTYYLRGISRFVLNNLAPDYLRELIHVFHPVNSNMRSANKLFLELPKSRLVTCADRSFEVAAPTLWNK